MEALVLRDGGISATPPQKCSKFLEVRRSTRQTAIEEGFVEGGPGASTSFSNWDRTEKKAGRNMAKKKKGSQQPEPIPDGPEFEKNLVSDLIYLRMFGRIYYVRIILQPAACFLL